MKALKCLVVFAVVAGLCTTALAFEPPETAHRAMAVVAGDDVNVDPRPPDPVGPPTHFSDVCPADYLGTIPSDDWYVIVMGDTCTSAPDYDCSDCTYDCSYEAPWGSGFDDIFEFDVAAAGTWQFDTMCVGWDTSLMIREETGGGCPGEFKDCDGDSAHAYCGAFESAVQSFLYPGTTYYIIVDGWSTGTCGPYHVWAAMIAPACYDEPDPDGSCDDLAFCNGVETCDMVTGQCLDGPDPCPLHLLCNEDAATCDEPNPCFAWKAGLMGNSFFPYANAGPGNWILDDIELERGCAGDPAILDYYMFNSFGRDFAGDPQGSPYYFDMCLWTVLGDGSCKPDAMIYPETYCQVTGYIAAGGSDPDQLTCTPSEEDPPHFDVVLPDNSGDFARCEIDFFMGYIGSTLGAGFAIAGDPANAQSEQTVGGPAGDDDWMISVFFPEDAPGAGTFGVSIFSGPVVADFGEAEVCIENLGECCVHTRGMDCFYNTEEECDALGGAWTVCKTWEPPDPPCDDPDGDAFATICGDNCPGVFNPGQEDCDNGDTPEGDACETDPDYADDDGDGTCNKDDLCPNDPNKTEPGICGCGTPDVDNDMGVGDGVIDCLEDPGCENDLCKSVAGQCTCGMGPMVMPCEGVGAPGYDNELDSDGDGVADCNDQCPGVDDAIFAPGCQGAIPTVSEWGLVILALLLLVGAKVYFGRRAAMS